MLRGDDGRAEDKGESKSDLFHERFLLASIWGFFSAGLFVEDFEHVGGGFRVVHDTELLHDFLLEGWILFGLC